MKGLIRRVTVTVVLWSVCSIAMAKSTITLDGEINHYSGWRTSFH
ncbi:histidine ammonia-lyase (histidase) pre-protein [Escherichia coli]|nr:histidine ammonia-lyase (histidase) pre-protein [Escherichia coli]STN91824.1 histidine ammonia-lyase (histidase) pre-protein [Escherichia coli]